MLSQRAPKQWTLTKNETLNSFTNWKENLLYTLSLDPGFAPFLVDRYVWQKKTTATPTRGFTDDNATVPEATRKTAAQKCTKLDLMLGQIANYATVISRNTIVKNSTSLNDIWLKIREHYGFQTTGSRFLDLSSIQLQAGERAEDLYQRICSFFDDNLLTVDCGLSHHGDPVAVDEDLSPTVENVIVYLWLERINPALPQFIKQRYGTELRNRTLASLKPEISQALDSLLDELKSSEEVKVMRSQFTKQSFKTPTKFNKPSTNKYCCLCRTANRPGFDSHYLSQCRFLPEADRRMMSRIRQTDIHEDYADEFTDDNLEPVTDPLYDSSDFHPSSVKSIQRRVSTRSSPHMKCFYKHHPVSVCIDTGAESSLISERFVHQSGIKIHPTTQRAVQADIKTPLNVIGEIKNVSIIRGAHTFQLEALVVKDDLGSDIVAGEPFLELNDIALRSARKQIIIKGRDTISYAPTSSSNSTSVIKRSICRAPESTTIFPGESLTVRTENYFDDEAVTVEPRTDSKTYTQSQWPPAHINTVIDGQLKLLNSSPDPIYVRKNEHLCQLLKTVDYVNPNLSTVKPTSDRAPPQTPQNKFYSSDIIIDPDNQLSLDMKNDFLSLHQQYDTVFEPIIGRYNDSSGKIRARVNIGPVTPPTKKLRVPHYSTSNMQILQDKFDELEAQGVFCRPEDVDVIPEHVSPSFLVRKPSGGYRLVTAFTSIGEYSKTLPSVMPTVNDTLRTIASWRYIITTDLRDSFYQIPLDRASIKWCATPTPYRGLRVYMVSAQGMPGSSETLEEMMCTIFGDMIQNGTVAKIADDLYVGGSTFQELHSNWAKVLHLLKINGLTLKAPKTTVAPCNAVILGWSWQNGKLSANSHKLLPLTTCKPPETVSELRSFIGSYKIFNRVLRHCTQYIDCLEAIISGKAKNERIAWTELQLKHFREAQEALKSTSTITLPIPSDHLILVHDGSVIGIGSVLYLLRNNVIKLGGFFSAKLKSHQALWQPCEIEALSIAASVLHFGPYLRESMYRTQILTDNKPCVQAWAKMIRGEFSTSARIATFMSTLSQFNVDVHHISGCYNLPSDFLSRNPPTCSAENCQICKFIDESSSTVVRNVIAEDIIAGSEPVPYSSRASWKTLQLECPDLRRVHAHLTQGTRPTLKKTKVTRVKRYLQKVSIGLGGLLVVKKTIPFRPPKELIVVPQSVLHGFLTALHLRLNHPTINQLKKVFDREFFALNSHDTITSVVSSCSQCQALKATPRELHEQSTCCNPSFPGTYFAADVMRRYKQYVLILRDIFSSFTNTTLITDEGNDSLRDSLITSISHVRPSPQTTVSIRCDNAPGLQPLFNDPVLKQHNIILEPGRVLNRNKNPVAEKAVEELGFELLRLSPEGGPISPVLLAEATSQLNSRVRSNGLSAYEIFHQRDQNTGQQLEFSDTWLKEQRHLQRESNHLPSARHKSQGGKFALVSKLPVGSLIYLKNDGDKTKSREKYIITKIENDNEYLIRKFTKTQLRSKEYLVKSTEIYPITPTTNELQNVQHNSESDSDDDANYFIQTDLPTPAMSPIPSSATTRTRRKPHWMLTGEYDLSMDSVNDDD